MYIYIYTYVRRGILSLENGLNRKQRETFEQPTWGFCQLNLGTKGGGTIPVRGYSMTRPVATI